MVASDESVFAMTDTSIGVAGHGSSPVPAAPTPDSGRTVRERGRRRRARVEGPAFRG